MSEAAEAPHSLQRRVISPEDADDRLREFGMTVTVIHHSIEAGDTARRRVMLPVYPCIFAGVTMWAETLATWRKEMLKRRDNYEIGRTRGYETIYCLKRGVAFTVVAGDGRTGKEGDRDPRLKREKGVVTSQRIDRNREASAAAGFEGIQGELIPRPKVDLPPDEACETWFLIVRPTKTEVRLELSRPILMDGGIVSGFSERILLPPVAISGAVSPLIPGDGEDDGGDDGDTLVE